MTAAHFGLFWGKMKTVGVLTGCPTECITGQRRTIMTLLQNTTQMKKQKPKRKPKTPKTKTPAYNITINITAPLPPINSPATMKMYDGYVLGRSGIKLKTE
jgi:hypothetical protein